MIMECHSNTFFLRKSLTYEEEPLYVIPNDTEMKTATEEQGEYILHGKNTNWLYSIFKKNVMSSSKLPRHIKPQCKSQ